MEDNIIKVLTNKKNIEIIATLLNEEYNKIEDIEDIRFGDRLFDLMVEINTYLQENN